MVLLLARLLVAEKVDTITWLTKDMVKYPLKKLNNDNKDLVVGGLNSNVANKRHGEVPFEEIE